MKDSEFNKGFIWWVLGLLAIAYLGIVITDLYTAFHGQTSSMIN